MSQRTAAAVLLSLSIGPAPAAARVWYVRADAPPAQNGTTWDDAFASLSSATMSATSGDEIWVTEGIYAEKVTLPSGAALYGGFAGDETIREARNWRAHATTVDAGGNDDGVYCFDGAVLDGITVTGAARCAVTLSGTTAWLRNCRLCRNGTYGTYLPTRALYVTASAAEVIDCVIADNAGIAIQATNPSAGLLVRGCRLLRNAQKGTAADGIRCEGGSAAVEDCLIACNNGDGVRLMNCANMALLRVTVADNEGAGINVRTCARVQTIAVTDSIVWGNGGGSIAGAKPVTISYSCIEATVPPDGQGNFAANPGFGGFQGRGEVFVDPNAAGEGDGSPEHPYRSLVSAALAYEYALCSDSPCMAAASDGGVIGAPLGAAACPLQGTPVIHCAPGVQDMGRLRFGLPVHVEGSSPDTCMLRGILDGPRSGCRFTGFSLEGAGSALIVGVGQAPQIGDCRFSGARVESRGCDATLLRCVVTGGEAACAIAVDGGRLLLVDTEVTGNAAGGLYVAAGSEVRLSGCLFRGNGGDSAAGNAYGGAAYVDTGTLLAENCVFEDNVGRGRQGGALAASGAIELKGCLFRGNRALYKGGALYITAATALIEGCRFYANFAASGGALYSSVTNGALRAAVFRGNVASKESGAVRITNGSTFTCEHLTLVANAAPLGAGIVSGFNSTVAVTSSIVWGNAGGNLTHAENGTISATFSCVGDTPLMPGIGNIDADPRVKGWGACEDVYLDPHAAPGGDGTLAHPRASFAELCESFSLDLCEESPCIGAGEGGNSMGAGHPVVAGPGARPVAVHLAAGVYEAGIVSIAYDVSLSGAGADASIVRGSLWGLCSGRHVQDLTVTGGTAGLLAVYGDAVIERCMFSGSLQVAYYMSIGAQCGVRSAGGNVRVEDCRFTDNEATALYFDGGTCVVERCRFEHNAAGAMSAVNASADIVDCTFLDNDEALHLSGNPHVRVQNAEMRAHAWRAVSVRNAQDVVFDDVTIVENRTSLGAVVECVNSTCRFEHTTIARNTPGDSGALYVENCVPEIASSIIWGNMIAGVATLNATPTVSYSCMQESAPWPGPGNVALDPRFTGWGDVPDVIVDPAAPAGGDGSAARPFVALQDALDGFSYALGADSPCIGAGEGGSNMGAGHGTTPAGLATRTVHIAAGTLAIPQLALGEQMHLQGAGADRTFLEGPLTHIGSQSSVRNLCMRASASRGLSVASLAAPLLEECVVTACAGGIFCGAGSMPTLRNVVVRDNNAGTAHGGGLLCGTGAAPLLEDCVIAGNRAKHGGGIYCDQGATLALRTSTIAGNTAERGGGLYCGASVATTIAGCRIAENQALDGAGLYCGQGGRLGMDDVVVERNGGEVHEGAGVFGENAASLNGRGVRVIDNWTSRSMPLGVGISWHGGEFVLTDSEIARNSSDEDFTNGSLYLADVGTSRLQRVRVVHNSSGVSLLTSTNVESADVLVRGNLGRGLDVAPGNTLTVQLEDWTIVENAWQGVRCSGTVTLAGCTIASNAQYDILNHGTLTIEDSIVWNDALTESIVSTERPVRASYCCIRASAVVPGIGNLNVDPRFSGWGQRTQIFVDAAGAVPGDGSQAAPFPEVGTALDAYRYALAADSPCIGAANGGNTMGAALGIDPVGPAQHDMTIFCAAGSYTLGSANLARHVTFLGAGAGVTVLRGTLTGVCAGHSIERVTATEGLNGAVSLFGARDVALRDAEIIGNSGPYSGGLRCRQSTGTVERCTFRTNTSRQNGGAAALDATSEIVFKGCSFQENSATLGGAVYVENGGKASFAVCSFTRNQATNGGGGGALYGGCLDVRDCGFTENLASSGGAICTFASTSTIAACRFVSNRANTCGALYSRTSLRWCDFIGNTAELGSGACMIGDDQSVTPVIEACRFIGNGVISAAGTGGALTSDHRSTRLVNCVLAGNAPDATATLPAAPGSFQFVNCAFDANARTVVVAESGRAAALNSIFWRNGTVNAPVDLFSCVTDRDPGFVRPGTFTPGRYRSLSIGGRTVAVANFVDDEGDYHLRDDSPAIDAGAPAGAPALDMQGLPRPCGASFDIGPYEACSDSAAFRRGDANADGTLDIADAVFSLRYLFAGGLMPGCMDAADANDDGRLDLSDAVRTLTALFRNQPLPPPYDACGDDPTIDWFATCFHGPCK